MKYRYAVLTLGLIVLLLISACGGTTEAKTEEQIPARANVLASIRVADILTDEDINRLIDQLLVTSGEPATLQTALDEVTREIGIDLRDLTRIMLFGDVNSEDYFGAFIEGSFVQEDLRAAIEAEDGPLATREYKGQEIFTSENEETSLVFLDPSQTLVGSPRAVRDAINVREGDAPALSGSLLDAFQDMGDSLIRVSFTVPEEAFADEDFLEGAPFPGFNADIFTDIRSIGLALDKRGDAITVDVSLDYSDEESAQRAEEVFQGLLSVARGFIDVEGLGQIFDSIEISSSGSAALISYSATVDELESAIATLGELGPEFFGEGADLFGQAPPIFGGEEIIVVPRRVPDRKAEFHSVQAAVDSLMADEGIIVVNGIADGSTSAINDWLLVDLDPGAGTAYVLAYLRVNPTEYYYCFDDNGLVRQDADGDSNPDESDFFHAGSVCPPGPY